MFTPENVLIFIGIAIGMLITLTIELTTIILFYIIMVASNQLDARKDDYYDGTQ